MRKCAFLTTDNLEGYVVDDELAYPALQELGWTVDTVSWRTPNADWDDYEAVIIRSPWDYQNDPDAFLDVLATIDRSKARLANPLSLVRWNLRKIYLRDLRDKSVPIVPTIWEERLQANRLPALFDALQSEEIVLKPVISASAEHTYPIKREQVGEQLARLLTVFQNRAFMAQPFMPAIVSEGEFSLFHFGGDYSHTILKTPKAHDFRVQEEHGGLIQAVAPPTALLASTKSLYQLFDPQPLYARADYVRTKGESFALMELELIEPALYFRMDAGAAGRFAQAFDDWMQQE